MKRVLLFAVIALMSMNGSAVEGNENDQSHHGMTGQTEGMMGQMGNMMGGMHPGEQPLLSRALRARQELGLSEDQVRALESVRSEFDLEARRRLDDIQAREHELGELLQTPQVDLGRVESKAREIANLQADLRLARIRTLEKGKAILTAEQRQKLLVPGRRSERPTRGADEMRRFMNSERMPQAMDAMMEMARRMGDGDTMLGMVRMMEMMGSMGDMMGGGMMGDQPGRAPHEKPAQ